MYASIHELHAKQRNIQSNRVWFSIMHAHTRAIYIYIYIYTYVTHKYINTTHIYMICIYIYTHHISYISIVYVYVHIHIHIHICIYTYYNATQSPMQQRFVFFESMHTKACTHACKWVHKITKYM